MKVIISLKKKNYLKKILTQTLIKKVFELIYLTIKNSCFFCELFLYVF